MLHDGQIARLAAALELSYLIPKIYPITDVALSGLSHAEQVSKLVSGGARFIQLRDKSASPDDFYRDAAGALKIARQAGAKIIINDRVDIALALGADGVHVGQDDMPADKARGLLGPEAIVGVSTHNLHQVRIALSSPISYIAFGPVFSSNTKIDHDDVVGLSALRAARQLAANLPLVAIGGINAGNVRSVFDTGVDSAAIISDLFIETDEIGERYRFLNEIGRDFNNNAQQ